MWILSICRGSSFLSNMIMPLHCLSYKRAESCPTGCGIQIVDVQNYLVIRNDQFTATLCHYPLLIWEHPKSTYMIHGHLHDNPNDDFFPLLCTRENVLNAAVEINGYIPVTLEELIENNNRFKAKHHPFG